MLCYAVYKHIYIYIYINFPFPPNRLIYVLEELLGKKRIKFTGTTNATLKFFFNFQLRVGNDDDLKCYVMQHIYIYIYIYKNMRFFVIFVSTVTDNM